VTVSSDPRALGKNADFRLKRAAILFFVAALLLFILDFATPPQKVQSQVYSNPATDTPTTATSPTTSCQKSPVTGVTASANGLTAPNVLDNNFNTAWSNNAFGSWIQVDLGGQKTICSLDLAWYHGTQLRYNFVISVSNDGATFTNVFEGKSSGAAISFETYFLQGGTEGRYVRITVNENNVNSLAGIAELAVYGYSSEPLPAPTADNENVRTSTGTPVQIILTGNDPISEDALKFSIVTLPQHGTVKSGTGPNAVTYTPDSGFTGTDSFTYKATNGKGVDSNTSTVTMAINAPTVTMAANEPLLTSNTVCARLSVARVTASGYEYPNVPSNVLDNNLNIRWSNLGIGSSIQADLGVQKTICSVDIAWYRGNLRVNNFVISVSNDGTTFRNVFTGKSSGKTLSPETYVLPGSTTGRYVRVTVNGNTENNWASITELSVYGSSVAPSSLDKFGIKELYPTKANGEQWYINMQNPASDPQLNPNGVTLTRNADGSYKVQSNSVRLQVYTSSGYHQNLITTYDQRALTQKGYMQSPNDWKNVEITGYMKVNHFTTSTTNGAAHIELLARGGTHTSTVPCEGTAHHSNTYETGRVKFEKELEHTAGYTTNDPQISGATGTLQGKWVGVKAVFYTFQNGSVKLEQWLDDKSDNINSPGNNWHKVLQFNDIGNWGGGSPNCGGTPTTIITWGGPLTHFRWDNIDDMDIKDLSVREIQPPQ